MNPPEFFCAVQTLKSTQAMADAMRGATKVNLNHGLIACEP